jgi:hypothetical protein
MKLLILTVCLIATAMGLYFSGNHLSELWGGGESPQKISAVKPKSLQENLSKVSTPSDEPVYSFFETLNDTTMTRYVGLNGELLPAVLPPEKSIAPAVPVKRVVALVPPVEKKEKPEPLVKKFTGKHDLNKETLSSPEIKVRPAYAVQVSSFRNAKSAQTLKTRLQKQGFDAFLMETVLAEPGGTWHRVFLGRYVDEEKAQEAARLAKSQYKLNAVVVRNTNTR